MAYTAPTPANLKARYPAFAAVDDAIVQTWLEEGAADCATFPETMRARAEMAYAAHRMAELGLVEAALPAGVTAFKSGTFSASVSDAVAARTGLDTTIYGQELKDLRRRAFAGPRMAWSPPVPGCV